MLGHYGKRRSKNASRYNDSEICKHSIRYVNI